MWIFDCFNLVLMFDVAVVVVVVVHSVVVVVGDVV